MLEAFLGFLRYALAAGAGAAGATTVATGDEIAAITGGILALVSVVWKLIEKRWAKPTVLALFLAVSLPVLTAACAGLPAQNVAVSPELAQRQALLSAEIAIQDVFNEIGFLMQAGKLTSQDVATLKPYADAIMVALRTARAAVMQGVPAQNLIDEVNAALQALILAKQQRQGSV